MAQFLHQFHSFVPVILPVFEPNQFVSLLFSSMLSQCVSVQSDVTVRAQPIVLIPLLPQYSSLLEPFMSQFIIKWCSIVIILILMVCTAFIVKCFMCHWTLTSKLLCTSWGAFPIIVIYVIVICAITKINKSEGKARSRARLARHKN